MNGTALSIILDGLVLVLLTVTIVFAARLSLHLRDFRQSREGMDRVLRELADNIIRAERAVQGMRETAKDSGRDLQERINEARSLLDELDIMAQSGNSLAKRLEKTADRGRKPRPAPAAQADTLPSFMIRDPDLDPPPEAGEPVQDFIDDETGALQSRAERELFEALRGAPSRKKEARSLS